MVCLSTLALGCAEPVDAVTLSVSVVEYRGGGENDPGIALQDARVCETDADNCVRTDARGRATLSLPGHSEVSYTVEKEGYDRVLQPDVTDADFLDDVKVSLWPDELAKDWYEMAGSRYPLTSSGDVHILIRPPTPGATVDLVDASGDRYYAEVWGSPNPELEATTAVGNAGFVGIAPGEFQVELGGTARVCVPLLSWPANTANRIRFPVRAGYLTIVSVSCIGREGDPLTVLRSETR
jgi:hypothetical protein